MSVPEHTTGSGVDDFVAKWRAREPEMMFAEPFCTGALRPRFRVWGALLFELREAAFELSDARVIAAKSAWWADELIALAQRRPRHPLTRVLTVAATAPWPALAQALLVAAEAPDGRPADREAAFAGVLPLAGMLARVEAALFEARADDSAVRSVAAHLLAQRLRFGLRADDAGRVPLHLLARHAITAAELPGTAGAAARRDWAHELLQASPSRLPGAPPFRLARAAFDRRELAALAAGMDPRPAMPIAALWRAWRAARA